ncbi:hypothetical protein BY458DRAFT_491923 [Sporodiniella umbellata]|nr:hypothetical protein BY458DRAFT_491923 [Sporodiniella umbellata]
MMWPLLKSNDNSLSIELLEPVIFVGPHLHASPVIRGTVNVKSFKPYLMKHLAIKFQGIARLKYVLNNKFKSDEHLVTENHLTLYSTSGHDEIHRSMDSGSTALFSFEMPIPNGLPETVQSPQIQVNYQFTLCMDYIKDKKKLRQWAKTPIVVARLPRSGILTGENLPEMIDSRKHISPWCQYRVTLPTSVALGATLPVRFELVPVVKGLKLKHVVVQLLERRTVIPDIDREERTCQFCYFVRSTKKTSLSLPSEPLHHAWEASAEYQIPCKSLIHSTDSYNHFNVGHILLISFVIQVLDEGTKTKKPRYTSKTICFSTRIDILDQCIGNNHKLPPYQSPISIEEREKLKNLGIHHDSSLPPPPAYHAVT